MDYKTIANDGIVEEEIKKSRFICHLKRISNEEEGREYIAQIKKEHHKANHSCSAMIVGEDGQIKRSSDDGEPSGTAGVPMLTVLEKQGLTNVVAVVTRYFGGIKLGAGGLIRAYSGSVAHAIEEIGRVDVKELTGLTVELTYSQYQVFSNFLEKEGIQEFDTTFLSDLVGRTPIIKLNSIVPEGSADVYVKLEAFNPGSSVKDRIALRMIEDAEKAGIIKPGNTIIEPTSGNTGIGLAWVGAAKGYKVVIVMPDTMSVERRKIIQAYGAELVLTPGSEGMKGAIAKAKEVAAERDGWVPLQFANPSNPAAHADTTGQEILEDFGADGLDAFVAGIGTGGTISGVSKTLKAANPNIKVYGIEADESAVLNGDKPGPHKIQGISTGFIPDTLNTKSYDSVIRIPSDEAISTSRTLGGKEGFLAGISSGAAIAAALKVAAELGEGKKVLTLLPDNGERYLSTTLYDFQN